MIGAEVFAMRSKPRKRKTRPEGIGAENIASAGECTGLVPALPETDAEEERLTDLYRVHEPKRADDH